MYTVPVVDVGFDPKDRVALGRAGDLMDLACRENGFLLIVGHGIPGDLLFEVQDVSTRFFRLDASDKERVRQPEPAQVRGWSPVGSEGISYSLDEESPGDLKEKMDIGPFGRLRPQAAGGPHFAPNLWPAGIPLMREVWEQYYLEMDRLCRDLMRMAASGLGLDLSHFDTMIDQPISMLRALWYPDQPEQPLAGQMRAGVHSDYGTLTVIAQGDAPGGLEYLDRGGEWFPMPIIPGALVVMVGDILAAWTADRWHANLHRVVNPPREQAMCSERLSFAFYHHPNEEVLLAPVARTDTEPVTPGGWYPTAGEYLRDQYVRQTTFGQY